MYSFIENALRLKSRGYTIVPLLPRTKRPVETGWQHEKPTDDQIRAWAKGQYKLGSIGINTHDNPAVDIDVYDETVAGVMEDWVLENIADAPTRVGLPPKRLLLFKTNQPFRKLFSEWVDKKGVHHKIEILGSGQQFVAYGIHPDTKQEYEWTSIDEPMSVDSDDLPMLDVDQANRILDEFDRLCTELGWKDGGRSGGVLVGDGEGSDLETYKSPLALSEETIDETLRLLDNDDADYDTWLTVGMALHHQYKGGDRGLELWHEWGERSDKYSAADTNRRYASFGHGPATVTFATLLKQSNEIKEKLADEAYNRALNKINACNNEKKLLGEILKELAENSPTEYHEDIAIKRVQLRLKEINGGVTVRLEAVRKAFVALRPKSERFDREVPKWCENWCYLQKTNMYYNTKTGLALTRVAFDTAHGKYLLTDTQRATGEAFAGKASDVATNLHEIPQVYDQLYLPGVGDYFSLGGVDYVNLYSEDSTPRSRPASSPDEKAAIRTVEAHVEMLFPDEFERDTLLDYLAYCVQYPAEKIRWAILIQGVSGAGKTFFFNLMASVLGSRNTRSIDNKELRDSFTAWREGSRMVFIEEIRLADDTRFKILEDLLTVVGNTEVSVRNMQRVSYQIPNVTNYVMFTMFMDALPLSNTDRRYFVIRTSLQTKSDIETFLANDPTYFERLYGALDLNDDILRDWLLNRKISDSFMPKGRAPDTDAKNLMRAEAGGSDALSELEQVISEGENPLISNDLLSATEVKDKLMLGAMSARQFGHLLSDAGFAPIGKYRITGDKADPLITYYTRNFLLFHKVDKLTKIRELAAGDGLD